jgi:hypothetical protein
VAASQTLTVSPLPVVASQLPSGAMTTAFTPRVWPVSTARWALMAGSQILTVRSPWDAVPKTVA